MKALKNGTFVLLLLWVLPSLTSLLGFLFGSPGSGLWDGLVFGVSAAVLAGLLWAMVHFSRPMRRLRTKVLADDPSSETQIVTL